MTFLKTLAPALILGAALFAANATRAEPPALERMGVYVAAEDLDRSAAFYEELFGKPPQARTPGLVAFDVAGGLYAVVSRKTYAPDSRVGGNVVPYIKVADVDGWFERVRSLAPGALVSPAVVREGPIALFKFRDPDGNLVEMFSLAAAPR